eukprot:TRINITY_DN3171_c0_g1_i15.p2 TRINITY_DN3171_c0_g1~~TRINITY_DN3171_c0_g1_i15.p2  ORF type:complete len:139 (-),score=34.05 TRINITY_DN3171_c0_g1_i15:628-999(-)
MDGEVLRFVIPSDDHTIFVTGISKQTTEEELFDMLSVYGPLYKVKIVEKEKSRSLTKVRFAFAKFYSLQHAKEAASEMKGIILHGSILNVKYESPQLVYFYFVGFQPVKFMMQKDLPSFTLYL